MPFRVDDRRCRLAHAGAYGDLGRVQAALAQVDDGAQVGQGAKAAGMDAASGHARPGAPSCAAPRPCTRSARDRLRPRPLRTMIAWCSSTIGTVRSRTSGEDFTLDHGPHSGNLQRSRRFIWPDRQRSAQAGSTENGSATWSTPACAAPQLVLIGSSAYNF